MDKIGETKTRESGTEELDYSMKETGNQGDSAGQNSLGQYKKDCRSALESRLSVDCILNTAQANGTVHTQAPCRWSQGEQVDLQ